MIQLNETIQVNRPIEEVFSYVSDFSRIREWDPGVVASDHREPGHAGEGSVFDLTLAFGLSRPRMTYAITSYEPPVKVVLKGQGDTFSAVDTIRFRDTGAGTRIDYQADIRFSGAGRLLEPLITPLVVRAGKKAMQGLLAQLGGGEANRDRTWFRSGAHWLDWLADHSILPGMLMFSRYGYNLARRFWTEPNTTLYGRKIILTGGTSGIGKAAAFQLAAKKAFLTIVARNREKAEQVCQEIKDQTGNPHVEYVVADLSLIDEVRQVADQILRTKKSIDVLINNAGALFTERRETAEGLEQTFALDLLGVFVLTEQLAPALARSADPRIINVSSGGMYTQKIDVDDLENRNGAYSGAKAYARAKRGLVILTRIWAKQFRAKGIQVHAMHPGWVDTPGIRHSLPEFHELTRRILRTPDQGADTMVWLAASDLRKESSGRFWLDRRPRETVVFPGTGETEEEARQLYRRLKQIMSERT